MAEVGVLNLTIKDNSGEAASGLQALAGALNSVKSAVNGLRLNSVATQIQKIADSVKNHVTNDTIAKLNALAEAVSKMQGVGNIDIKIDGSGVQKVKDTVDASKQSMAQVGQAGETAAEQTTQAFAKTEETVQKATEAYNQMKETMQETTGQTMDFSQFDPANLPFNALGMTVDEYKEKLSDIGQMTKDAMEQQTNAGMFDDLKEKAEAAQVSTEAIKESVQEVKETETSLGQTSGGETQVFSSMEEAAKALGITVDEVQRKLQDTLSWLQKNTAVPVGSTLEEAAQTLGIPLEQAKQMVVGYNEEMERSAGASDAFANSVNTIDQATSATGTKIDELREKVQDYRDTMSQAEGESLPQYSMAETNAMAENIQEVDLWKAKLAEAQVEYNRLVNSLGKDNVKTVKLGLDISELQNKINAYNESMEEASSVTNSLTNAWQSFKDGIKNSFPTLTGMVTKLGQIAKYRFLRAVLKQITSGISEGLENVYWYSKAVGTNFATSMDSAATSLLTLKNSIGASLTPVISALIPYLEQIVSWFVTAINYVNQFFSLLNGSSTWTKAVTYATDAYTDSSKKASETTKDLLADWDELNIIQSTSSSSGNTDTTDYTKMFEEMSEFDGWIEDLVDGIEETFGDVWTLVKRIGVAILAWKVASGFSGIIASLAGLVAAGAIIGLVFDLTTMFDNKYFETGDVGWLVADVVTTALGAYLAGKVITKVLGAGAGMTTAGITLIVSALADVYAFTRNKDVTALSTEGIITAIKGGVKVGAGFMLFETAAGVPTATAIAAAGGYASIAIGAIIGIKAVAEAADAGEVTMENVKAAAAGAVVAGLGVTVFEYIGGATLGAAIAAGGYAALVLAAAFAVAFAIVAIIGKPEKNQIKWGDYEATEEEVKAFVEGTVFAVDANAIVELMDPVIEVNTENEEGLKASVAEVTLTAKRIKLGYDSNEVLKDLEEQIFGNSETGTTGLIAQFKETAKGKQNIIETGMTIVPTFGVNDDGSAKRIIDTSSDTWTLLTQHMDALGRELSTHLSKAYQEGITEEAKAMELKSILEISQMMTNVASSITQGEQWEIDMEGLEANIKNLSQGSWDKIFDYIDEYKEKQKETFADAYDQTTQALTGQQRGLKTAMENILAQNNYDTSDATYQQYKEAYDWVTEQLNARREGRDKAIEKAADDSMDEETLKRIREAFTSLFDFEELNADNISQYLPNENFIGNQIAKLFDESGNLSPESLAEGQELIEGIIIQLVGSDNFDTVKKAIDAGILSYKDFFSEEVITQMASALRIGSYTGDAEIDAAMQESWKQLIGMIFGDSTPDPELLGQARQSGNESASSVMQAAQEGMQQGFAQGFTGASSGASTVEEIVAENTPETIEAETTEQLSVNVETEYEYETPFNGNSAIEQATSDAEELQEIAKDMDGTSIKIDDLKFNTSGAVAAANNAATAFEDMAKRIRDAFSTLNGLTYEMDINGQKYSGAMTVLVPQVQSYASGGYVTSGDLVMANENGNFEMMGKMGNQPVIANNQQIVNGISSGVSSANENVVSELRGLSTTVTKILNKEFSVNYKASSTAGRINQQSANAYSRVTG